MPRAWFRHDSQMRYDPAVERLVDEFGAIGDLLWRRLLEVRCQADRDLDVTIEGLASMLAVRPSWEIDLGAWLARAADVKLIKLRNGRDNRVLVRISAWEKHQPTFERTDHAREKKRRQRAQTSPGTTAGQQGDVPAVSPPTDVTVRDVTDETALDVTTRGRANSEDRSQAPENANGAPADPAHVAKVVAGVHADIARIGRPIPETA